MKRTGGRTLAPAVHEFCSIRMSARSRCDPSWVARSRAVPGCPAPRAAGREARKSYDSDRGFELSNERRFSTHAAALRRLADRVLEVPDLEALARLLTRELPRTLEVAGATLLLWDRKLESFQVLSSGGQPGEILKPGQLVQVPDTRFLLSDGALIETSTGEGEGILVPLLARSGLVGMLVLGARPAISPDRKSVV